MLHIFFNESLLSAGFVSVFVPTLTLAVAFGVVCFSHPVHNLLSLITVFFISCGLLILVGAEFAAFLFLIVYVGAIMILFLFVIMLLNLNKLTTYGAMDFSSEALFTIFSCGALFLLFGGGVSASLHAFFIRTNTFITTNPLGSADALT
jgi:NADH:ubiquinone oxidoreductase subunit 6 (subunit J)